MNWFGRSEVDDELSGLRTVGIVLGPYRNLTTLVASVLSLHPECQVLNHAGKRLLSSRRDFIGAYSDKRLAAFCRAAVRASRGGRRGDYGGSILLSHAFDNEQLRSLYEARYGQRPVKEHITSLVWKESQFVTSRIRSAPDTIHALMASAPKVRFLLPVRNPMDCAMSNVKTGHAERVTASSEHAQTEMLEWILENLAWFAALERQYPERFFSFYEDDPPATIGQGLAALLELDPDERWSESLPLAFTVNERAYGHTAEMYSTFESAMQCHFRDLPDLESRLRTLVGTANPS
jgi:hypothetical protein